MDTCYGCGREGSHPFVVVMRVEQWVADVAPPVQAPNDHGMVLAALCRSCATDVRPWGSRRRDVKGYIFQRDDPGVAQALSGMPMRVDLFA